MVWSDSDEVNEQNEEQKEPKEDINLTEFTELKQITQKMSTIKQEFQIKKNIVQRDPEEEANLNRPF
jgi:hypothetical protein